mmetsp:Transcript_76346/g.247075  ORF Transcript_76346/g.247075 Transcript_76346/m.247075 type:complete len:1124 (-) Transcript_76346:1974-5345(-)
MAVEDEEAERTRHIVAEVGQLCTELEEKHSSKLWDLAEPILVALHYTEGVTKEVLIETKAGFVVSRLGKDRDAPEDVRNKAKQLELKWRETMRRRLAVGGSPGPTASSALADTLRRPLPRPRPSFFDASQGGASAAEGGGAWPRGAAATSQDDCYVVAAASGAASSSGAAAASAVAVVAAPARARNEVGCYVVAAASGPASSSGAAAPADTATAELVAALADLARANTKDTLGAGDLEAEFWEALENELAGALDEEAEAEAEEEDEEAVASKPGSSSSSSLTLEPEPGATFRLKGLMAKPEMNGKEGKLGNFLEETGRWECTLAEDGSKVNVKRANFDVIASPPAPSRKRPPAAAPEERSVRVRGSAAAARGGGRGRAPKMVKLPPAARRRQAALERAAAAPSVAGSVPSAHSSDKFRRLREALCQECSLQPSDFEPSYDIEYDGSNMISRRGKEDYIKPSQGWIKLALSVTHRYDDPDWLRKSKWPVVYHGTSADSAVVSSIVQEGFKIRGGTNKAKHGERLGTGIYCSPLIDKAMRYADVPLVVDDVPYTLVFQCRARRDCYSKPASGIWLVEKAEDIRPSGILLYPFALTDDMEIRYSQKNPYRKGSEDYEFYEGLRTATTIGEARRVGRRRGNLLKDLQKGRMIMKARDGRHFPKQKLVGPSLRKLRHKMKHSRREARTTKNMALAHCLNVYRRNVASRSARKRAKLRQGDAPDPEPEPACSFLGEWTAALEEDTVHDHPELELGRGGRKHKHKDGKKARKEEKDKEKKAEKEAKHKKLNKDKTERKEHKEKRHKDEKHGKEDKHKKAERNHDGSRKRRSGCLEEEEGMSELGPRCARSTSVEGALSRYRLDNNVHDQTTGLSYRSSKSLCPTAHSVGSWQRWGSEFDGVDQGDGWIRVDEAGGLYLPAELKGVRVAFPVKQQGTHVGGAATAIAVARVEAESRSGAEMPKVPLAPPPPPHPGHHDFPECLGQAFALRAALQHSKAAAPSSARGAARPDGASVREPEGFRRGDFDIHPHCPCPPSGFRPILPNSPWARPPTNSVAGSSGDHIPQTHPMLAVPRTPPHEHVEPLPKARPIRKVPPATQGPALLSPTPCPKAAPPRPTPPPFPPPWRMPAK